MLMPFSLPTSALLCAWRACLAQQTPDTECQCLHAMSYVLSCLYRKLIKTRDDVQNKA